jgi:hypothetical protein
MPKYSLDLMDLYAQLNGGAQPQDFEPQLDEVNGVTFGNREVLGVYGARYYETDKNLDVEYYMPVSVTYTNTAGKYIEYYLPHPVMSVTAKKIIVETPLVNRRGTVKELIQTSDYDIVIKGLLVNKDNEYPERQVAEMLDVFEPNRTMLITSVLSDLFLLRRERKGSNRVVVRDIDVPGRAGIKHVVPYTLRLTSDEPFSLKMI